MLSLRSNIIFLLTSLAFVCLMMMNHARVTAQTNCSTYYECTALQGVSTTRVQGIELDYKESKRTDQFGNQFRYRAKVKDAHDAQLGRWAWDVILQVNPAPRR